MLLPLDLLILEGKGDFIGGFRVIRRGRTSLVGTLEITINENHIEPPYEDRNDSTH